MTPHVECKDFVGCREMLKLWREVTTVTPEPVEEKNRRLPVPILLEVENQTIAIDSWH
jgi:hypothetical protein